MAKQYLQLAMGIVILIVGMLGICLKKLDYFVTCKCWNQNFVILLNTLYIITHLKAQLYITPLGKLLMQWAEKLIISECFLPKVCKNTIHLPHYVTTRFNISLQTFFFKWLSLFLLVQIDSFEQKIVDRYTI